VGQTFTLTIGAKGGWLPSSDPYLTQDIEFSVYSVTCHYYKDEFVGYCVDWDYGPDDSGVNKASQESCSDYGAGEGHYWVSWNSGNCYWWDEAQDSVCGSINTSTGETTYRCIDCTDATTNSPGS
jgi:hypothetical protein